MTDFLTYVKRRKAELIKEIHELEVAERVFKSSNRLPGQEVTPDYSSGVVRRAEPSRNEWDLKPSTIKEQVIQILTENDLEGLTAQEILGIIRTRWTPSLERTSLSPQLSRLRKARRIYNRAGKWYLSLS